MTKPPALPGDPTELHLHISYNDELGDTPHADTLERWNVAVLHRRRTHRDDRGPGTVADCDGTDCLSCTVEEAAAGSMTFYRVHLDRSRSGYAAMAEESEDLYEIAQAVLDPATGYYTEEFSEQLEYTGSALLVMDRVTLERPWRGHGIGAALAAEAIHRLMLGARAVVCSPGVSDLSGTRLRDQGEWDRVVGKIAGGWELIGFRRFRDTLYFLSPAWPDVEEERTALRRKFLRIEAAWAAQSSSPP
ncbi:hypothetical protein GPA10_37305 [Streptomyces sp. p1417]|uniref:Uncharacterized protein n=1 Tax=Streptomyces typhae TaxID=2681492 RepID=A0A6L6X9W3_9ACTN|nr:hypothetical protein [Streptomyces typhae]MVO90260.1 hypothetical protein [Streptomyces typhae]